MHNILVQMAIYLAAAVVAVPLTQRLGFGSVLGFLVAGLVIGPVLGIVGAETEELRHYAEFGVVLMLFIIGLEIKPKHLWEMRRRLLGLGGAQVVLTLGAIAGLAFAFGLRWNQALALGIILSLSSTAIVMQTLNEKRLSRSTGGQSAFSVLLFQDVAAIPFLALIPLLAPWWAKPAVENGHGETGAFLNDLPTWLEAPTVAGVVIAMLLAGRYLTPHVFRFISHSKLHEIYVATALLFVVAVALLMEAVGLSPALGTFLAGVMLATSEYRHEIEADIAPFKGLLLGLFFITVGASIDLGLLVEYPLLIIGLTLALMAVKFIVLLIIAMAARLKGRDRLLFTLSLAQAGEFGFFLLSFATQTRVISGERGDLVLMVISLSMFLTPLLFITYEAISRRYSGADPLEPDAIDASGPVLIIGVGRFGQVVNRLLKASGHETVLIDNNHRTINNMRQFGIRSYYGDITRPATLEAAGVKDARAVVIAIDDPDKSVTIASYLHRYHPDVRVIVRARDRHHVYQLYAAGAPDSVREVFDSAVRAGKYALEALGHEDWEVERLAEGFVEHDRAMLKELASLWDPETPIIENKPYMEKAREQHEHIEDELRGRMAAKEEAARKRREKREARAAGAPEEEKEA